MQAWNKSKKLDPVQNIYVGLTTTIRQLCENPELCQVLLDNIDPKKRLEEP
jgi:hypothetical protein